MDSITLRLPHRNHHTLKIKKATLAKILIAVELIGIIMMAWHLRVPLYKKYLAIKPKAYSISSFDSQKRYLLSENDFLLGSAPPDSKVKLIFNPGRYKRTVKVSNKGNWVAQLPKSLQLKRYRLTLANFDKDNKLTSVSSFKVRVQSESVFSQNNLFRKIINPLSVKAANAQENFSDSLEFKSWVRELQVLGLYVYCETNAEPTSFCSDDSLIIITDAKGYQAVCRKIYSCSTEDKMSPPISTLVDPTLAKTLTSGQTVPYIHPISDLLDNLVTPPNRVQALAEDLENTPEDALSEDERVLLLSKDGLETPYIPYVDQTDFSPVSE